MDVVEDIIIIKVEEEEEEEELSAGNNPPQDKEAKIDTSMEHQQQLEGGGDGNPLQEEEEEVIKKKYGGILPKKPPLIAKDHERAFFDSADWALGKQGAGKPKIGPLEALRPKLQPTPHQHMPRSAYAPATDDEHDYEGVREKKSSIENEPSGLANQSAKSEN